MPLIPFTAYVAITPTTPYSNRWARIRSIEKIAKVVTDDLRGAGFDIVRSNVAFAPKFGEQPDKLTIIGLDKVGQGEWISEVASAVCVDAPYTSRHANYAGEAGKIVCGYLGTKKLHPGGQTLDPRFVAMAMDLKEALESACPTYLMPGGVSAIYRLDYMNVIFGAGGYSFQR